MSKKYACSLLMSVVSVFAAESQINIGVDAITMQPVSDIPCDGGTVDLTRCDYTGTEFDVKIWSRDSLTSVLFPDRRYDFTAQGDTTMLVCEETRRARVAFPRGIPFSTTGLEGINRQHIIGDGRYSQARYIRSETSATIFTPAAVDLVTTQGDTLRDARFEHLRRVTRCAMCTDSAMTVRDFPDSLVMTSQTDTYYIMATDESFPRIIKKVTTLSSCDGVSEKDSVTYALTSRPVKLDSDKPRPKPKIRNTTTGDGANNITMSPDGNSVTVIPPSGNSSCLLVINDILGRTFLSQKISDTGQSTVDISSLPRGEYLIQLLADDNPVSVTKYLKN